MLLRMQQRRGSPAEWADANTILADGELGYEKGTGNLKVGDGISHWNDLPYSFVNEHVIDAQGDLIVGTADNVAGRLARGSIGHLLVPQADGSLAWTDQMTASPVYANGLGVIFGQSSGNQAYILSAAAQLKVRVGTGGLIFRNNADNTNIGSLDNAGLLTVNGQVNATNIGPSVGQGFYLDASNAAVRAPTAFGGIFIQSLGGTKSYGVFGQNNISLEVKAQATNMVPLSLTGIVGQNNDLFRIFDAPGGTQLVTVDKTGNIIGLSSKALSIGFIQDPAVTGAYIQTNPSTNDSGAVLFNTRGVNNKAVVLRGTAGQVADFLQVQTSIGGQLAAVDSSGGLFAVNGYFGTRTALGGTANVLPTAVGNKGLVIRGQASHTANLLELQDSASDPIATLAPNGSLDLHGSGAAAVLWGRDNNTQYYSWYVTGNVARLYSSTAAQDRVLIYNTGTVEVVTAGAVSTLSLKGDGTGGRGSEVALLDTKAGQATPNKFIRSFGGKLQILNSGYTLPIAELTDAGSLTLASSLLAASVYDNGNRVYSLSNPPPGSASAARIISETHANVTVVNTIAASSIASHQIPTTVVAGDLLRLHISGDMLNNTGANVTYLWGVKLESFTIAATPSTSYATSANRRFVTFIVDLLVVNPTNDQRARINGDVTNALTTEIIGAANNWIGRGVATVNLTTITRAIQMMVTMGTASPNADFVCRESWLEIIPKG